jgi:copper type II ascorbate-dependent monooxygenase-like protein
MCSWARRGAAVALLLAGCGGESAAPAEIAPARAPGACDELWRLSTGSAAVVPGEEAYRSWVESSPSTGFVTRIAPIADRGGGVVHHLFVTRGAATPEQPMPPILFAGGRGSRGVELPPGTGLRIEAGEELELGLHLVNPTERAVHFDAGVELCIVREVAIEADVVSFGPEQISIPPDRAEHTFAAGCPVSGERTFFAAWPHMHALGTRIEIALGVEQLVSIPRWDAADQPLYPIDPVRTTDGGEVLSVSCSFVNTGSTPVGFGHYARDEMCLAFLYYFPAGLARGWGCGRAQGR